MSEEVIMSEEKDSKIGKILSIVAIALGVLLVILSVFVAKCDPGAFLCILAICDLALGITGIAMKHDVIGIAGLATSICGFIITIGLALLMTFGTAWFVSNLTDEQLEQFKAEYGVEVESTDDTEAESQNVDEAPAEDASADASEAAAE